MAGSIQVWPGRAWTGLDEGRGHPRKLALAAQGKRPRHAVGGHEQGLKETLAYFRALLSPQAVAV